MAAPIIAVFTKYDLIVSRSELEESEYVKTKVDIFVQEQCIKPIREAACRDVPNMVISSESATNQSSILLIR